MELLLPALEVRCWTGRKDLLSVLPPLCSHLHAEEEEPAAAPPERGSPAPAGRSTGQRASRWEGRARSRAGSLEGQSLKDGQGARQEVAEVRGGRSFSDTYLGVLEEGTQHRRISPLLFVLEQ